MPVWFDWKLAIAVCALAFTLFQFLFNWRNARKEVTYDYSSTAIKGFDNEFGGRLNLTFEGQPVSNVSFVKLFIRNSGKKTVDTKDYDGGLTINIFSDETLWGIVTDAADDLKSRLDVTRFEHQITINPIMLNTGDEIGISILAKDFKDISVIGRISGIKSIKRKSVRKTSKVKWTNPALLTGGFGLGVSASAMSLAIKTGSYHNPALFFTVLIGSCFIVLMAAKRWI